MSPNMYHKLKDKTYSFLFYIILAGYGFWMLRYYVDPIFVEKEVQLHDIQNIIEKNNTYFTVAKVFDVTKTAYLYQNTTSYISYNYMVKTRVGFDDIVEGNMKVEFYPMRSSVLNILDLIFVLYIGSEILYYMSFFFDSAMGVKKNGGIGSAYRDFLGDQVYNLVHDEKTRFTDIIGQDTAKKDLQECMNYFIDREEHMAAGHKVPRGFIFTGKPGTGKTMLAKAFAGESGVKFLYCCGSDFMQVLVGLGSRRIRQMFQYARDNAPCIIFIDEIDAIGSKRDDSGHKHEQKSTLNTILTEMDGFNDNDNVLVIAATNMPDTLDDALLRSGRFDKEIIFDPPNKTERVEMFKHYLKSKRIHPEYDLDTLAQQMSELTGNLTGADINNICNQATGLYMRRETYKLDKENAKEMDKIIYTDGVTFEDLKQSVDIVLIGMAKPERAMSNKEREIVSWHEAGHALTAYLLKTTDAPIKVSIIPRGRSALGFSQQPSNDRKLMTEDEVRGRMSVLVGGRMAEEIKYGTLSTGAADDLEKVVQLAHMMIYTYGFGPIITNNDMSDYTKKTVDKAIQEEIQSALNCTHKLLTDHFDQLEALAQRLLEREVITNEDMDELFSEFKNTI